MHIQGGGVAGLACTCFHFNGYSLLQTFISRGEYCPKCHLLMHFIFFTQSRDAKVFEGLSYPPSEDRRLCLKYI